MKAGNAQNRGCGVALNDGLTIVVVRAIPISNASLKICGAGKARLLPHSA
jgi:hypothetical protein